MSSKQKRSSGGYGLRRKVAKKRLDEDFEYYFSKLGTQLEASPKQVKEQLIMVTELAESSCKSDMKTIKSPEKKSRGRPKKLQLHQNQEVDFTDSSFKVIDVRNRKSKKLIEDYVDDTETSKAVNEVCSRNEAIMTVACEEEIGNVDCIVKRIKLGSVLSADGITGIREEEVTSLPEGEKENLPEEGIHLGGDSDVDECLEVQMDVNIHGDIEENVIYEEEEQDKEVGVLKTKRKYKKGRLSQEAIQKLSQLSPDDKIECSDCHKLLKPSSFRQHLRTHTGEKPFGCDVCEARFTRKGDVERHVRIVHNKQKPFKCCRCQRAFGDKKNLRWHLTNHDKKLFYVCEVCGFKFGKREYWENHVRFIHPIPGGVGLDESEVGEDQMRALTKSLLGEDESTVDNPNQDSAAAVHCTQDDEHNMEDINITEASLPLINQDSSQTGLKIVNVKSINLPSLLNIDRPKLTVGRPSQPLTSVISQNQGIEAVVIQFDGSNTDCNTLQSVQPLISRTRQFLPPNLLHIIKSASLLQVAKSDEHHNQSIVIDTQEFGNSSVSDPETPVGGPMDVIQEQVVEATVVTEGEDHQSIDSVTESNEEPSKLCIMLSEGGTGEDSTSASAQTLVEALLVAAKGDCHNISSLPT